MNTPAQTTDEIATLTLALQRLERRLQREHAARLEAEAIAEAETLKLWENAQRLSLLETIATVSNADSSVETVFGRALELICGFTKWPLGHVYFRDPEAGEPILRSSQLWFSVDPEGFEAFRHLSDQTVFVGGVGLPGRVMAQASAQWLPDVTCDPNFPRGQAARSCGLRAGYAIPIFIGNEVAAVLEFFLNTGHVPDDQLLQTLERVGAILGRVIERDRTAKASARAQIQLERMVEEAQAANRAKTSFLAVTSHEIRTPLNAVLGLAEALRRTSLDSHQIGLAEGILDSGSMLLRLLNAVLDIAKVETGVVTLAESTFDLAALADQVIRLWRATAEQAGLALELDVRGLQRPCLIHADAGKVEQTLVNLVSNALKFSPRGSRVRVALGLTAEAGGWRVDADVIDQGPGVPGSERARIFQAYEQTAHGREAGGAGLGLAICAANMEALGGEIWVTDADGGGSHFHFRFTARRGDSAPAGPSCSRTEVEVPPGVRVLVAEDNLANQRVLAVLMEPMGLAPTFVMNGAEAVAAVQAHPFDIVLMDANMPVMDGATAVRRIRALPGPVAALPIFMVTANVFEEDRVRYSEAGADGVLPKPIVVADLFDILTKSSAQPAADMDRCSGQQLRA